MDALVGSSARTELGDFPSRNETSGGSKRVDRTRVGSR